MRIVKNMAIGLAALALSGSGVAFGQSQSGSSRYGSSQSGQSQSGQSQSDKESRQSQSQGQTGAYGQSSSQSQTGQQGGKADKSTKDFIKKVAESNTTEVDVSRLAEQKAENSAVRDLARQMVRDHEQLSTKLQSMATDLGVVMPSASGQDKEAQKLSKETGNKFDKQYVDWIVKEHKKDISTFEKEADKDNASPQIKTFASDTLPKLRHHLMMAESVQQQVQSSGKGSKSSGQSGSESGTSGTNESSGSSSGGGSKASQSGTTGGFGSAPSNPQREDREGAAGATSSPSDKSSTHPKSKSKTSGSESQSGSGSSSDQSSGSSGSSSGGGR